MNPDPRTSYERDVDPTPSGRPLTPATGTPLGTARILSYVAFALAVIALFFWPAGIIGLVLGVVAYSMGDRRLGMWSAIANVVAVLLAFIT
jgi:hypothetical protein